MRLNPGDKIKFKSEKLRYTVQSACDRYAVCTKPFNPKHTVLYTIIDFERNVRGRENLIFCMGFETKEQCEEAHARLIAGESQVSWRYYQDLDIEKVFPKEAK